MTCPKDQPAATCPRGQPAPAVEVLPRGAVSDAAPARGAVAGALARLVDPDAPRPGWLPPFLRPGSPCEGAIRTTALVVWAVLAGACRDDAADPVRTAQAFTAAVQRGDMKAVLPLLEQAASDRLTRAAEQASDQVGGRRRIEPAEMLQIVDVPPTFELAETVLVDNDGATAHVRLVGAQQETYTLTLVREDGAWHVRIPTPP